MHLARQKRRKVGLLKLLTIWPFPEMAIDRLVQDTNVETIIVPEMNLGQLRLEVERVVRGRATVCGVNRADGEMIPPQQILEALGCGK